MMMLVVHVEDCIWMMLRKKWHEWIECTFCQVWYHTTCQKVVGEYHFMCDGCEHSDDSG
jgi:hypothetical protein